MQQISAGIHSLSKTLNIFLISYLGDACWTFQKVKCSAHDELLKPEKVLMGFFFLSPRKNGCQKRKSKVEGCRYRAAVLAAPEAKMGPNYWQGQAKSRPKVKIISKRAITHDSDNSNVRWRMTKGEKLQAIKLLSAVGCCSGSRGPDGPQVTPTAEAKLNHAHRWETD